MRIFNKFKGTKGFLSLYERVLRFRYMITEQAKRRAKILAFWERYGAEATKEAFGTSRRTLFRWQKGLEKSLGKLEGLNPIPTVPKNKRKRRIPEAVQNIIIKERTDHPRLGKEKLQTPLAEAGFNYSISTVGRMLTDLKDRHLIPQHHKMIVNGRTGNVYEYIKPKIKKERRPKHYTEQCTETDSIIKFIDGIRRYLVTGIDTQGKFAFAYAYTSHTSKTTSDFLKKMKTVCPTPINSAQTDNGSEFMDHFREACIQNNIKQFHTYPRSPKMNSCIERFNRTVQEEFVNYNLALLRDDLDAFNQKLIEYLIWYNTKRPHHTLGLVSPLRYIVSKLPAEECQRWWTYTLNCDFSQKMVLFIDVGFTKSNNLWLAFCLCIF